MEISKARLTGGSFIKGNINAVVQEDLGFGAGLSELITKTLSGVQNYQAAKEAEKAKQLQEDENINKDIHNRTMLNYNTKINNINEDTTINEDEKIVQRKKQFDATFGDTYYRITYKPSEMDSTKKTQIYTSISKKEFDEIKPDDAVDRYEVKHKDRTTFIGANADYWTLLTELERKKALGEHNDDLLREDKRIIMDIENDIDELFQKNGLGKYGIYKTISDARANMNDKVFDEYKTNLVNFKKDVNVYMKDRIKSSSDSSKAINFYSDDGEPIHNTDEIYKQFVKTDDGMNSLKELILKGQSKVLLTEDGVQQAQNQLRIENRNDEEALSFAKERLSVLDIFSKAKTPTEELGLRQKFVSSKKFGGKDISEYPLNTQKLIFDLKASQINDVDRLQDIIHRANVEANQDKLMGFGTGISESLFNQLSAGNKRAIISELASDFTYDVDNNPNSFIGISTTELHKRYPMLAYIKDPRITGMVKSKLGVIGNIGKVTKETINAARITGGSGLDNQLKALNAQAIVYLNGGNMAKLVETIKTGSKNGVNFSIFESAEAQLKSAYSNGEVSQIGNAVQLLQLANGNGYSIKSELLEKIETVQTYMNVDIETAATQVFRNKDISIDNKTNKIITKFIGDKSDGGLFSSIVDGISTSESKIVTSIGKNTLENHMKTLIKTDIAKTPEEAFDIAMEHIDNNSISGYKDQPYKYIKPDITKENISNIQFNIAASLNAQAQKSGGKVGIYPSAIIIKANDPFNANTTWNVSYQTSTGVTKASRPYTTEELQKLGSARLKTK